MLKRLLQSPALRWDKPFTQRLVYVALPIIIQNLVTASLHIIDGLMLSQLPGDAPYAGVTQVNRYTFVFQLFVYGIASGSSIYMSQYFGSGQTSKMRTVLGLSLRIGLIVTLVFAGLAVFAPQVVTGLFLPPGESFDYAVSYLRIVGVGYLFTAIDSCYAACLKSGQRTVVPMIAGVTAIVVNTVLNYGLIFGRLGLPQLGVEGAAIATVIAGAVAMLINMCYAYGKKLPAGAPLKDMALPDKAYLMAFLKRVLPVVANEGIWAMGMAMYSIFYGRLGDQAVAAVGIYNTVDELVFVAIYGVMNASAILVGAALGAEDKDLAYLTAKRMLVFSALMGLCLGLGLMVLRRPLVGIFQLSPEGQEMALKILFISALFLWARSLNSINIVGVLRAGGDTVYSTVLDCLSVWCFGVPLVGLAALVFKWPIEYVFLCSMMEEAVKAVVGLPRFKTKKWMNVLSR
ncbi:MAG: MATE family efflux transporter [Clostridia bacterium]|nr:MATE family efflux transporter [Clostridia bacterium]